MRNAVRPLFLVGSQGDTQFPASHLRAAFGDALSIVTDLSAAVACLAPQSHDSRGAPALAIGVFPITDLAGHREFARDGRAACIPTLSVAIDDRATFIGPVAWPTRPGCGQCARHRMIGAMASTGRALVAMPPRAACPPRAMRRLATEIRAFLRGGPRAQRLVRHVLAIDHATSAVSRHRVVPMPYCETCGGARAIADEPSAAGLDGWVDPVTGVIAAMAASSSFETGLALPIVVTAAPPHLVEADGTVRRLPLGWGKGLTPADAVLSAVGEAIERYAPSVPDPERIVMARPGDLDGPRLDPGQFALYSPEQYARARFPFAPYDRTLTHPWVQGWWLGTGEPVWVPAVFVYLSIEVRREQLICQGSSN
ncbi:MAG: TOMM precursor leader peptide-binding protein, partial [Acidobacteriota bacterium]